MNKKEIAEIRKQFSPSNCAITRICGCYVDGEKQKKAELKEAFLSLPEEEMFKYFELFKKTLSGTIGKNLLNLAFPLEEEFEDGRQTFLLALRDSKLKDEHLLHTFYDSVIESYDYGENYYIILIHASYDIPGKSSDNTEIFDGSEYVYEHILCAICPVNLSKPGLCYNETTNSIEDRIRDWIVAPPQKGFLFPAFNDRNCDIHNLLYYTKNPEELQEGFVHSFLGCSLPLSAKGQKSSFSALVEETLGTECDLEAVKGIHEQLGQMIEANKDAPEPLELDCMEVKKLLADNGASKEQLESFDANYEAITGDLKTSYVATNIGNTRKFEVKTPRATVSMAPEWISTLETRIIDGRRCLIIPLDDQVEVNGIHVRTLFEDTPKEE